MRQRPETQAFEAVSVISAVPARVWAVLIDIGRWPDWDSGITGVKGRLAPGAKLRFTGAGGVGSGFPFKVATIEPGSRLVLAGTSPLGLFTGVRTYSLEESGDATRFTVAEEYSGRLAATMLRTMPDLTDSFQHFAAGLKNRVEAS